MAPKGGKGGGGSSGSSHSSGSKGKSGSSCRYCSYPIQLSSSGYDTATARAILALQIIFLIITVACMIVVAKRPWLKLDQKKDRYKVIFYMLMGTTQLLFLIFSIVDSILHQVEAETTYAYYITYIFRSLFWRCSDIFMIVLILRCLEGARNAMQTTYTKLRFPHLFAILLLSLVTLIAWCLYTRDVARILTSGSDYTTISTLSADTAYTSIAFVLTIWMVALVLFIGLKKAIPTTITLLLLAITGSYWLSSLLNVIFYATAYWRTGGYTYSLGIANGIIAVLAGMVIFICLAMLSSLSNKRTKQLGHKSQEQSFSNSQPGQVAWVPKNDQQSFTTDTSYHGGHQQQPPAGQWPAPSYGQGNTYDPAAQPLYPTQTYNPPQQTSHVYDSSPQYPPMQQPPMQQPDMQQPQRFYGNNHAYAPVPQAGG